MRRSKYEKITKKSSYCNKQLTETRLYEKSRIKKNITNDQIFGNMNITNIFNTDFVCSWKNNRHRINMMPILKSWPIMIDMTRCTKFNNPQQSLKFAMKENIIEHIHVPWVKTIVTTIGSVFAAIGWELNNSINWVYCLKLRLEKKNRWNSWIHSSNRF